MCCERSGVGAALDVDAVPRSAALAAQPLAVQRECTLAGGDDYELLFTAPPARAEAVRAAAAQARRGGDAHRADRGRAPACACGMPRAAP